MCKPTLLRDKLYVEALAAELQSWHATGVGVKLADARDAAGRAALSDLARCPPAAVRCRQSHGRLPAAAR